MINDIRISDERLKRAVIDQGGYEANTYARQKMENAKTGDKKRFFDDYLDEYFN